MLLMVKRGIKSGICHVIRRYVKASNNYMKNYEENEKIKNRYILSIDIAILSIDILSI